MNDTTKIVWCIVLTVVNAGMAMTWWPMNQTYALGHLGMGIIFGVLAVKLAMGWTRMDY